MTDIISIILPIFLLIGLGFLAARLQLVSAATLPALGNIIMYFAIPALVINAVGKTHFSELFEPYYLLSYAIASLGVLVFGWLINRYWLQADLGASAIRALGMSVPNSMFIGFPLIILLFPDNPPIIAFIMAVLIEVLLIIPLALVLLEVGASDTETMDGRRLLRVVGLRIVKNPLLAAMVVGLLISVSGISLPAPINKTMTMLTQMTAPLALFFVGITLAQHQNHFKQVTSGVSLVVFGKLLLHPLLAALLVWLLPDFDARLQVAVIVISAAPMITIYPIIGEHYGYRDFCAQTLFVGMLVAFFSLITVLALINV